MDTPGTTSGSSPALLINGPGVGAASSLSTPITSVEVHPLVLLSVLDHHTRRQEGAGRVIGTLLGSKDATSGRVEITNCFAVPHAERGDEVAIGKDFNRQMMALHMKANRKEMVVGWYATALPVEEEEDDIHDKNDETNGNEKGSGNKEFKCIADTSSLIHEFYAGECEDDPVHLVMDTSLAHGDSIAIKAYKSTPVQIQGEPLANLFHEIHLSTKATDSEKICLDHMITGNNNSEPITVPESDTTTALQLSMEQLYAMLETASDYVDSVVDGETPADDKIGRRIADTLSSIPKIRPEVFDRMFNDSLQDLLMVTYLSNITRTQLTIAEKLNAALAV